MILDSFYLGSRFKLINVCSAMSTIRPLQSLFDLRANYTNGHPILAESALLGFEETSDYDPFDIFVAPLLHTADGPCAWSLSIKGGPSSCYAYVSAEGVSVAASLGDVVANLEKRLGPLDLGPAEKIRMWESKTSRSLAKLIEEVGQCCSMLAAMCPNYNADNDPVCVLVTVSALGEVETMIVPGSWRNLPILGQLTNSLIWEAKRTWDGPRSTGWIMDQLVDIDLKLQIVLCGYVERDLATKEERII